MDALRLASLLSELPVERTRLLDNLGRVRREVGPLTPELSDALAHMSIRRLVHGSPRSRSSPSRSTPYASAPARSATASAPAARRDARARAARRDDRRGAVPRPLRPRAGGDPRRRDPALRAVKVGHAQDERRRLARARAGRRDARGLRAARRSLLLHAPLDRESVLAELRASGLAGYGGAGFPTAVK